MIPSDSRDVLLARIRTSDKESRYRFLDTVTMAETAVRMHRALRAEASHIAISCSILTEDIVDISECIVEIFLIVGKFVCVKEADGLVAET